MVFLFILGSVLGVAIAFDMTVKQIKDSNEAGASAGHLKNFAQKKVFHSRKLMTGKEYDTDCKVTKGKLDERCQNAVEIYKKDPDYCEWLDKNQKVIVSEYF